MNPEDVPTVKVLLLNVLREVDQAFRSGHPFASAGPLVSQTRVTISGPGYMMFLNGLLDVEPQLAGKCLGVYYRMGDKEIMNRMSDRGVAEAVQSLSGIRLEDDDLLLIATLGVVQQARDGTIVLERRPASLGGNIRFFPSLGSVLFGGVTSYAMNQVV